MVSRKQKGAAGSRGRGRGKTEIHRSADGKFLLPHRRRPRSKSVPHASKARRAAVGTSDGQFSLVPTAAHKGHDFHVI
jgi:hypothetical protein